jgi:hypothetical protein
MTSSILTDEEASNGGERSLQPTLRRRLVDAPGFDPERPFHTHPMPDGRLVRANDPDDLLGAADRAAAARKRAREAVLCGLKLSLVDRPVAVESDQRVLTVRPWLALMDRR